MSITQLNYTPAEISEELLQGDLINRADARFGIIWINPDRVSGEPCFYGTRVPVQILFDYIEAGDTIEDFLDGYPPITREHVLAVLEAAKAGLVRGAG